jgi:peptidoglycan hydrolase CwlO-like protein
LVLIATQAVGGFSVSPALADDSSAQQIAALNAQIAQYQAEIKQAGTDKKTLQAAINTLDLQRNEVQAQVSLTQSQISSTQLQIQQLGTQIQTAQQAIAANQSQLAQEIQELNESDSQPLLFQLVASGSLSDFWKNVDNTVQVQNAVQTATEALETEKASLATSQTAVQQKNDSLSSQNKTLTSQQQALSQTVQSKSQLLAQTNGKESTYEKLLAAAQAQLQSFSNFTKHAAGGDKLLANQTACDSWGCYYNQRDTSWGDDALDGTNYSMASDGCLVTAMAMVMTHYGYKDVTPATINSNPANFAAYYPAYLLNTITVDGSSATRTKATIDATLATGNPVVIGMNVYGGTHFVVLVSGSGGSYTMRDPYTANGKDISFSSLYNLGEIYSISKVVVG